MNHELFKGTFLEGFTVGISMMLTGELVHEGNYVFAAVTAFCAMYWLVKAFRKAR